MGKEGEGFCDYFPVMAQKLGEEDFMEELCKGFELLADPKTGTITLSSLRKNLSVLGLEGMSDEELEAMLMQGDYDGDGALNQHEFCILMIRLSPGLISEAREWLEEAIEDEMDEYEGSFSDEQCVSL